MTNEQIEAERERFRVWFAATWSDLTGKRLMHMSACMWECWLARAELDPTNQPQPSKGGVAAIMGKWPGDETDEEIEQALAEGNQCDT